MPSYLSGQLRAVMVRDPVNRSEERRQSKYLLLSIGEVQGTQIAAT
jgi:hypothetical protein